MITNLQPDGAEAAPPGWKRTALHLMLGVVVLMVLVLLARDSAKEIAAVDSWVAGIGLMGGLVFVLVVVVLTSVFVPSSLFAAMAGAAFGLFWGTLAMTGGIVLAAALDHLLARKLLACRIERMLRNHPKLQAIQRAVQKEGFHLQIMLRLAPLNAVTVNYVLGAAGVRFPPFMAAMLGTVPGTFVEVYFGHVAKHVSKIAANSSPHSLAQSAVTVVGFLVCVALMIFIGRKAQRAIAEAEASAAGEGSGK